MGRTQDPLTGTKSFSIGGRMIELRERCLGMTDEERRWRAQFLKDQVLSHREPAFVPEYYKDTTNIFRRIYKTPAMKFEKFLAGRLGKSWALTIRKSIWFSFLMSAYAVVGVYQCMYNANDWTRQNGIEWFHSRPAIYPGDPDYPNFHVKTAQEFTDFGFSSSVFAGKVENPPQVPSAPLKKDQ